MLLAQRVLAARKNRAIQLTPGSEVCGESILDSPSVRGSEIAITKRGHASKCTLSFRWQ